MNLYNVIKRIKIALFVFIKYNPTPYCNYIGFDDNIKRKKVKLSFLHYI